VTRLAGALALLLASIATIHAHGLDPASLTLHETAPGVFDVHWRESALRLPGTDVRPVLPAGCRETSAPRAEDGGDHVTLRWTVDCGPGALAGETLRIEDLDAAKINALVSVTRLDGEAMQAVLGPRRPSFDVPAHPSALDVVRGYVTLGIEHILTGPDHLLFVFGLLLLVSASRLLVRTITAFTLGHSITLTLAVLGFANVPARPTEVLIAASVLLLAVELARPAATPGLLGRVPWVMALAFGLLHGLGFAGALREIGLPAGDVPLALASFNAGVEIGQIAFVAVVLAVGWLGARVVGPAPRWGRLVPVYTMGTLAAFWCYQRLAVFLE